MTNGISDMIVGHEMSEKIIGNYWTAEPIEEPLELQDAEDALVPLELGESFNYIGVACFIVLAAFGGILWIIM